MTWKPSQHAELQGSSPNNRSTQQKEEGLIPASTVWGDSGKKEKKVKSDRQSSQHPGDRGRESRSARDRASSRRSRGSRDLEKVEVPRGGSSFGGADHRLSNLVVSDDRPSSLCAKGAAWCFWTSGPHPLKPASHPTWLANPF